MKGEKLTPNELRKLGPNEKFYLGDIVHKKVATDAFLCDIVAKQGEAYRYIDDEAMRNVAVIMGIPQAKMPKYEAKQVYTTPQAIQMLCANPTLKFKDKMNRELSCEDGRIMIHNTILPGDRALEIDETWMQIEEPKPVDFMTALKAYNEYKVIYCIYKGKEYVFQCANYLKSNDGKIITDDMILYGKWYIRG